MYVCICEQPHKYTGVQVLIHNDAVHFLFSAVINACNASLRNDKFSAMATRTRKQYLNDLAESHVTAVTIEQANSSGRVGTVNLYVHCVCHILV